MNQLLQDDPSIQDAITRGYANYSGVGRLLRPKVEAYLGKRVKLEAMITAVKRFKGGQRLKLAEVNPVLGQSTINLRGDIAKVTVQKNQRTLHALRRGISEVKNEFIEIVQGIEAVTLIFDDKFREDVRSLFWKQDILDESGNLAAIIVQSPEDILNTPCCLSVLYNMLCRINVNIEETVSCYNETIIVVKMENVGKSFLALSEVISQIRGYKSEPGKTVQVSKPEKK